MRLIKTPKITKSTLAENVALLNERDALRAELAAEREKNAILVAAFQRARKHSLKHETFSLIEDALDAIAAVKP